MFVLNLILFSKDKSESSEMEARKEEQEIEEPDKIIIIDPNSEVRDHTF